MKPTVTPVADRRGRHVLLAVGRTALGAGLVVALVRQHAWSSSSTLPETVWVFATFNLLTLFGAATEGKRLSALLSAAGVPVAFRDAFRLVAIATLFSYWIPGGTGGDVTKLYYLTSRSKGRAIEIATALLVDRIVAFLTLLVLILTLIAFQPALLRSVPLVRWLAIAAAAVVLVVSGGMLILWSDRLRGSRLFRWLTSELPLARYIVRAADAIYGFRRNRSSLAIAAFWCLAGHFVLAVSLGLTGAVLLSGVSALVASTLALLGIIANVLPVTPGGLGVGEAATETIFRAAGASGGAIVIVAWRIGNLAISVLGGAFYMYGMKDNRQPVTAAAPTAEQSGRF